MCDFVFDLGLISYANSVQDWEIIVRKEKGFDSMSFFPKSVVDCGFFE